MAATDIFLSFLPHLTFATGHGGKNRQKVGILETPLRAKGELLYIL